jgi:K+-transporting ATPase KdpF subunit
MQFAALIARIAMWPCSLAGKLLFQSLQSQELRERLGAWHSSCNGCANAVAAFLKDRYGPHNLVARVVRFGVGNPWAAVRLHLRLRASVKGKTVILLTAVVTLLLFIYLLAALLRPEWF